MSKRRLKIRSIHIDGTYSYISTQSPPPSGNVFAGLQLLDEVAFRWRLNLPFDIRDAMKFDISHYDEGFDSTSVVFGRALGKAVFRAARLDQSLGTI